MTPDVLSVKFTDDLPRIVMMVLTANRLIDEVEKLHAKRGRRQLLKLTRYAWV